MFCLTTRGCIIVKKSCLNLGSFVIEGSICTFTRENNIQPRRHCNSQVLEAFKREAQDIHYELDVEKGSLIGLNIPYAFQRSLQQIKRASD